MLFRGIIAFSAFFLHREKCVFNSSKITLISSKKFTWRFT